MGLGLRALWLRVSRWRMGLARGCEMVVQRASKAVSRRIGCS